MTSAMLQTPFETSQMLDATSLSKRRKEKAAREGFERREARRQAEKAAAAKEEG